MSRRGIDISGRAPVTADPGPLPDLAFVAIADLVIDESYQRPIDDRGWSRIERIAAGFSWSKFSPMMVAPLEDKRFAVIDGQHRAHAAALCGITHVPALIAPAPVGQQAQAFVAVNGTALPLSKVQLFRAALVVGEPWALAMNEAVRAAGLEIATANPSKNARKPWVIYSIGLIRSHVDSGHGAAVTRALAAIRGYDSVGRVGLYNDYILSPWLKAVTSFPEPVPVACLEQVLGRRDPFKVVESAQRECLGTGRSYTGEAVSIWHAMMRDVLRRGAA